MRGPSKSSNQNVTFFNPAYMSKDDHFDWATHMKKYSKGGVNIFDKKLSKLQEENKKAMMKQWGFDNYEGLCLSTEDYKIYNSWKFGDPHEKHDLKWFRMVDGKKIFI